MKAYRAFYFIHLNLYYDHMNKTKIISVATGLALVASMALSLPALAQTNSADTNHVMGTWQGKGPGRMGGPGMMKPGVFGTVTAVNGNTITVSGRSGFGSTSAAVIYTVDATNATVKKSNVASTVSAIAVNDKIFVQGTVTGTKVVATSIMDGMMGRMGTPDKDGSKGDVRASSTPAFTGNGQPVIAGKISAMNGSSLTVVTTSNVTYTVDATNAKLLRGKDSVAMSSLVVGDSVVVQGTVNGTIVTASTVIDQPVQAANPGNSENSAPKRGIFGGIGSFFKHLFGF